jgi:hypothetical protein
VRFNAGGLSPPLDARIHACTPLQAMLGVMAVLGSMPALEMNQCLHSIAGNARCDGCARFNAGA